MFKQLRDFLDLQKNWIPLMLRLTVGATFIIFRGFCSSPRSLWNIFFVDVEGQNTFVNI